MRIRWTIPTWFAAAILPLVAEPVSVQPSGPPLPGPPPLPVPLQAPTGQAWLGVQLDRVAETTSAHIPALPQGVGMLVKFIDVGGPAEQAKVLPFDVIWKLDDQLLINSGQLATLLRLKKPGDDVVLSIFRGGQPIELQLKLGDLPIGRDGFRSELAENAILPGEVGSMRFVNNVADRTVTFTTDDGTAVLRKEGETYLVVIRKGEELIYEGDVSTKEKSDEVPKRWLRRVCAMKRGLDHAIENSMTPVRPPRPRVVPPLKSVPANP